MTLRKSTAFGKRRLANNISAALLGTACAVCIPGIALADNQQYNIPAGSLATTLNKLAETGGLQLVYDTAIAGDLQSKGLNGKYSPEAALQQLLGNSGLGYRMTGNNTVVIEKLPPSSKLDPTTLKPMTVKGKRDYDPNDPYNPDYNRTNASTATKTDTPIMETPYSVTVVPQQVLKDKQVIRIEDAVTSVAGVLPSWTNGGQSDVFMMRGFQNTNLYRDGFLQPSALGGGTTKRQVANLEQIEVLKGAGSMLYGRSEPGGVINLVTKRPQATSYNSLQQQFGSYGFYRTTADSTGKITKDDKLLYRVNLSYENADSFRDFVSTDSFFIAPSLTWNITNRTQANLDIEYQHFNDTSDSGIPPIGNRPAPVPINRQTGDPLNNKNVGDRTYVGANWSHAFNDKWKLTHRFGAEFLDKRTDFTFFFGQPNATGNLVNVNADFSNGNRGFNNGITHQQNYYTTLNLNGKFNTSVLEHSTLWGFDYFVIDNQGAGACCAAYPELANFNIFNPTYQTAVNPGASAFTTNPKYNQEWYGLYFQDQIKFPFNVYGNVGVRYDNASSNKYATAGTKTTIDDHFSPRGGLLWKPVNWLSVFGNYSENFGVSNNLFNDPNQQVLPAQLANQWELGAKTEFFNGRLTSSFAYFDLTKTNLPVPDPTNPNLQLTSGKQESRGYEFEVAGEILPGWRTVAAYTLLDFAKIVDEGTGGNTGNRMYNTPRNYGSLWNTYEFQNASLRGLKLGGGVVAASQSQGTNANNFQLPGYATMNLMASYGMKVAGSKVTLQLNANNLLDKTYYSGTNTGSMIGVAAPRMFMGSVKLEF
ncbi:MULTISPECIES: TonB-dependent siderophore receptor [Methylobacter]